MQEDKAGCTPLQKNIYMSNKLVFFNFFIDNNHKDSNIYSTCTRTRTWNHKITQKPSKWKNNAGSRNKSICGRKEVKMYIQVICHNNLKRFKNVSSLPLLELN